MDKENIQENIESYYYFYCIENVLRELIIDLMEKKFGVKWFKSQLPLDVRTSYEKGIAYEKGISWIRLTPHHPIYYTDFPDLKKVIDKGDNWDKVFKHVFKRKEVIVGMLTEIEPIRNKIAHNRKITCKEVDILKSVFIKVKEFIGEVKFDKLINKCTCVEDILDQIVKLKEECKITFSKSSNYDKVQKLTIWENLEKSWWFDEEYIGTSLENIFKYFNLIQEYANLPRGRGKGYQIELWVISNDINTKYEIALKDIEDIINRGNNNGIL